jgi:TonB-dependent SusC/RagA subfamily outer membrane receptor
MTRSYRSVHRGAPRRSGFVTSGSLVIVLLLAGAVPLTGQEGQVEGRVTATETGNPITGAQVSITGTNIGTNTGQNGQFVLLNVPAGVHELRVVAIGYRVGTVRVTVQPGATTTVNPRLTQSVLELDAVVVTGTAGAARLRELGSTISQIDIGEDVKDPPPNMDQMLQARVPGLIVTQGNGMAGAGAKIRLRGPVSVSQSNQPLIYIDGIRVRSEGYDRNGPPDGVDFIGRSGNIEASPLNDINPADIERIEVIKGAAASTLYGTEAAAGVIQIFTKKGSRGAPLWNLQIDQGWAETRPFGTEDDPYMRLRPKDNVQGFCPDEVAAALETIEAGGSRPDVGNCSWIRKGYRQKYAGSVAGGFDAFQYFASAAWEDYDGVLPLDGEQKVVTRGNFSFDISDKLRFDWNTSFTNLEISNTAAGNNAQGLTLNVYRAEQNYRQSSDPILLDSLLDQEILTEIDRLITGGTVYYTPVDWFTNRFTLGWDLAQQENRNVRPFSFAGQPEGRLFSEQHQFTTLTADYVGNVDYRLTNDLNATFSFGGQSITEEQVRTFAWGSRLPGPGNPTVSQAASYIGQEDRLRVVNAGFFFQNVFKLKDRYFLTGGVRFDGNSAFGEALGLQAYPKVSVSYVISDESWWPQGIDMKLRAALGVSGRAPGAFDKVRTWQALPFAGESAFLPDNVGNPEVGPERTREIEFGADAAWFDGRLSTEFTWYEQRTSDALFAVRQVPSLGFQQSRAANVGEIRNRGVELAAQLALLDRPNFGIDIGSSVFTTFSEVLDLGGAASFAAGGGWVETGFPVMAAKGIKIKNEDAIAAPDTVCNADAGDPCALDGQWIFGPQIPTVTWIQNLTLRFPAGVILSGRGEFQAGHWIFDGSSFNALSRSVIWPTCAGARQVLAGGGTLDDLTARQRVECDLPLTTADVMWFPADFWKLRDVTLSIPVDRLIPQASSARLTITAQNFVRWINPELRVFDPEMAARDNLSEQNPEISEHVPPSAILTASLRLTF